MSKSVLPFLIFVVLIPALSATAVELGREQIATGFTSPVFMTAPPGDTTRLFVVEQGGVIKIITLSNNNVLGIPFLGARRGAQSVPYTRTRLMKFFGFSTYPSRRSERVFLPSTL